MEGLVNSALSKTVSSQARQSTLPNPVGAKLASSGERFIVNPVYLSYMAAVNLCGKILVGRLLSEDPQRERS